MEAVAPTVGVVSRVTDVLATIRTWEGSPIDDAFARLLDALPTEHQRAQLPVALGEALMTLRLAPERAVLALDVAVAFDLYEASDGVARLLRIEPSMEVASRAAALATHPGASEALRDVVQLVARTAAASSVAASRQIRMAEDPAYEPASTAERLTLVTLWPGRSATGAGDPPVIAMTADAGSTGEMLELAAAARSAGARIRRLPASVEALPPRPWMPQSTVVITGKHAPSAWWTSMPFSLVLATGGTLGPTVRSDLLVRINKVLPKDRSLRLYVSSDQPVLDDPFSEIESFLAGAFRTHEMAFLTGMSKNSVASICRRHTELAPREFRGSNYWAFPTLVGLRAWNYVRKGTRRRLDTSLAAEFVRMANREKIVPVAVTSDGEILMEVGDGTYTNEHGQSTSDVFFVAGVIRERFSLGGQRSAPNLLRPTARTAVNPEVYGGSPTVWKSRVTVEAIDQLTRRALGDQMTGGAVLEYVQQRYPEIGKEDLEDARQLARELRAVS